MLSVDDLMTMIMIIGEAEEGIWQKGGGPADCPGHRQHQLWQHLHQHQNQHVWFYSDVFQHKLAEVKTSIAVARAFIDQCMELHEVTITIIIIITTAIAHIVF